MNDVGTVVTTTYAADKLELIERTVTTITVDSQHSETPSEDSYAQAPILTKGMGS